ncbi:uracil-DNA glycosylase [Bradyrhizobium sp. DASA03007]|uniref:uracil-DNA glycosylase n=1 Tax=unclassified Bradyrhizobium TaxID=2631580 RepID=UPI003F70194D
MTVGSKANRRPVLALLEISGATTVDRARAFALPGLAPEPMAKARVANTHLDHRRVAPEGPFRRPRLYVVGEAPGAEEAAQGRPFVGPAGRALREMLNEAGIDPQQVRLANAIPFRPIAHSKDRKPRNRSPTIEEVDRFGAAVLIDIRRSRPGVIVALGSTAARLFGESQSIRVTRKAKLQFEGHPLRITFHPAYVRRFGGRNGDAWRHAVADLRRAWNDSAVHLDPNRA